MKFAPWFNNDEEEEIVGNLSGDVQVSNEKATLKGKPAALSRRM